MGLDPTRGIFQLRYSSPCIDYIRCPVSDLPSVSLESAMSMPKTQEEKQKFYDDIDKRRADEAKRQADLRGLEEKRRREQEEWLKRNK